MFLKGNQRNRQSGSSLKRSLTTTLEDLFKLIDKPLIFHYNLSIQVVRFHGRFSIEDSVLFFAALIVGLALVFDYSNGFHDAANVVATIITTGALSPKKALAMAALCEFIGPFLFGTAVAHTIGKNIVDISAFDTKVIDLPIFLIIAILVGAISWNLITWYFGIPSSSSHALVGGMVGAVLSLMDRIKSCGKGSSMSSPR